MSLGIGPEAARRPAVVEAEKPPVVTQAEAARAAKPDGAALDKVGANGLPPEFSFRLEYEDSRGRLWTGEFKAKVLTVAERRSAGIMQARLLGLTPPDVVDPTTYRLAEMQAYLAFALTERPKWAEDLGLLHEEGVMLALYREVLAYEARFRGAGSQRPGANAGPASGVDQPGAMGGGEG